MRFTKKGMVQDANGSIPEQFYDEETEEFVLVSPTNAFPIIIKPKHKGFIGSQGNWGYYTTLVDNELITFDKVLNSLMVYSKDNPLKIKINDNADFWYIDAFSNDGIEDIGVTKIRVMCPAGTIIKFQGLFI